MRLLMSSMDRPPAVGCLGSTMSKMFESVKRLKSEKLEVCCQASTHSMLKSRAGSTSGSMDVRAE